MRNQLSAYIDNAISFLLLVIAGLTPLLFLNQTTEFYEMPKLTFLLVSTVLLLGMWIFSWILKGKVVITRTPLDIPLLVLLGVIIASTYFSESRYAAIYGNFPRVHGSAVSWAVYILLYFVTVSHLRTMAKIRMFLYVLYASAVAVAVITLTSFFGLFLPFSFAQAPNFTPTGSSFATVAFLLLLLPFPILSIINPNRYLSVPFALVLTILFGVVIALTGTIASYLALLAVFAICFFVSKPQQIKGTLALFLVPVVVIGLTLALAYIPLAGNVVEQRVSNFPKEIQLPFPISWKVSASAFRDAPFIGTGPSTYLFNFTSYKPVEFNQTPFWNVSFDTAYNEFLHVLGTIGFLGLLLLIFVCLIVLNYARRNFYIDTSDVHQHSPHVLIPALAISAVMSVVLFAIHVTTLVSLVVTLFLFAALLASQRSVREKVMELSLGLKASTTDNKQFDLLPVIIFILFLVGAAPLLYKTYTVVAADYYHRQALAQANQSGTLTYENLQRAESLNPVIDLYRVDMAQTNFALANAIATQKGPTQENPEGTLTDQDRQTIQTLLSQAINEGRASVALSPRSSRNLEVLAAIYRNISGVSENALTFSLDAYGRAIQRDPLNPALRVNVGGIYYSIGNYDLAIRFFTDAANLKPDYANAYYNLAIALRDSGDLENARLVAAQAVALLADNKESIDYQVATALVQDIEAQVPEAQAESALESDNLSDVEVSDLDTPPDVATPAAVESNPEANVPAISPTPTQ